MNNELGIDQLALYGADEVLLLPTLAGFILCLIMSFILRSFYTRRSFSLSGKSHIASILPILSAVVFIVIVVVKSSLALSLGLVGALSIVRFRTPIKEPEELVYLFLAIAIGLGYGAGHLLITTVLITFTLVVVYFWLSNKSVNAVNEYNFSVTWKNEELSFEKILESIEEYFSAIKLVRLDQGGGKNMAILLLTPKEKMPFNELLSIIKKLDSDSSVTFFENRTNW